MQVYKNGHSVFLFSIYQQAPIFQVENFTKI